MALNGQRQDRRWSRTRVFSRSGNILMPLFIAVIVAIAKSCNYGHEFGICIAYLCGSTPCGFEGAMHTPEHRWDVSRVAAQVVSGIGFIGAGTIIFHKSENVVRGLTTAAGLWVTAAIGLACGGGMYILSIASTILVLVGLEAFNFILRKFDRHRGTNNV